MMEVIIQPTSLDIDKILKDDSMSTKIDIDHEIKTNGILKNNYPKLNGNYISSTDARNNAINTNLNTVTSEIISENNINGNKHNNIAAPPSASTPAQVILVDDKHQQHQQHQQQQQQVVNVEGEEQSSTKANVKKLNDDNVEPVVVDIHEITQQQTTNVLVKENETTSATTSTSGPPRSRQQRNQRALVRALLLSMLFSSFLVALVALVWLFLGALVAALLITVAAATYIVSSGTYRWFYVAFKTAPRDIKALSRYVRVVALCRSYQRKNLTVADVFRQNVQKHPNKVCFIYEDTEWTFSDVEEYSNKIANIFKSHGYRKGDVVALFMENKPEFVCIWLGLSKLGIIIPLINSNLRATSLLHSFNVAKCQAIIFGSELTDAMRDISDKLDSKLALYQLSNKSSPEVSSDLKERNLNALLAEASSSAPQLNEKEAVGYQDRLVYIYTSGTTGLPKAAVINNSRFMFIAIGIHYIAAFRNEDVFYMPLPLYHTAGGVMSVGQALLFGSTVVIRKKFSASSYFSDCRKYNCTVAQYIGEMCRYILAVPEKPEDKDHKVRVIFGNGLRPQIWKEFVDRFNIQQVGEFYGATEGNANIVNVDNTVGAIGFVSRILPAAYPISVIRVDDTGEPIRGPNGLCLECKAGEPGVFIGKIIENDPSRAFLGYVDEKASEKKIVRDVYKKGDQAFLSGDIITTDEFGYLYFKDRTGDTFRWKGENVSTSEVEAIVSNLVHYKDCVVYGVEITGQEGRAGMAAIYDPEETINLENLAKGLKKELPVYARPQFIRILTKLDMTGTYKLKKVDLQKEGFDPTQIKDKIYYLNSNGVYTQLTADIYNQLNTGKLRL